MLRTFIVFLLLLLLSLTPASATRPAKDRIPPIAHIAGFTVGVATIPQMAKRFGKPQTFVGFHPNSENDWDLPRAGLQVVTNFDDLADKGQGGLADVITISAENKRRKDRALGFMRLIVPGMTRHEVLRLLKGRLPAPKVSRDALTWVMKGSATVHQDNGNNPMAPAGKSGAIRMPYTVWTADINFSHGRVESIDVMCQ